MSRKIYLSGNNIIFDFPFSYELKDKVKGLFPNQMLFNQLKRHPNKWHIPLLYVTYPEERSTKLFAFCEKESFEIDSEIASRLLDARKEQSELLELSSSVESDFSVDGLLLTPRPYQNSGIQYMVKAKSCINADRMRLGKTLQSLAAVHHLKAYPCLVVCKRGLLLNWQHEISKTLGTDSVFVCTDLKKELEEKDFLIVNPEKLHKLLPKLVDYNFQSIIYDEAHNIGRAGTQKFNAIKSLSKKARYKYALTGTPVKNRALDLVNILDFLGRLKDFGGKWKFINEYYNVGYDFSVGEAKDLDKLHTKLKSVCMVRRTTEEVFDEVPQKDFISVEVPLSNMSDYSRLTGEIQKLTTKAKKDLEFAKERKGKIFELRRILGIGKVDAIADWVEDFLSTGEQLVLFAHHLDVQKALVARFPEAVTILSSDSLEERFENMRLFQTKQKQLIICSLLAAGEGLDLSTADTAAFCELGWTPPQMEQAIARIEAVGKTNPLTYYTFIGQKTVDIKTAAMLQDKGSESDMVTSGELNEDSYVESLLDF